MEYLPLCLLLGLVTYLVQRALFRSVLSAQARRREELEATRRRLLEQARDDAAQALHRTRLETAEQLERRQQQAAEQEAQRREAMRKGRERCEGREQAQRREEERLAARAEALKQREAQLTSVAERRRLAVAERVHTLDHCDQTLQQVAGETRKELRERLVAEWVEEAREEAKDRLRRLETGFADPEWAREGRRVLDIASQRYQGHYLTERLVSVVPLPIGAGERVFSLPQVTGVIGEVARVKLTLAEDRQSIRLEGLDSFGREVARRAIAKVLRGLPRGGDEGLRRLVQAVSDELERDTVELGKRAFKELEIPRAHLDIVKLVGRLNYRTSYTQNQWKHAIESAFLCGMMAAEMGLDVKIARRAALMHDIGKALTHEIDGSHAVIGADYARRLGESELVANAIGAHHTDEPFNSPYALLVAAADAMSGGRPGARHEQADNYVQRIESLERIAAGTAGVDRVYAVQAGREVRIHVKEDRVSDERAAEMATDIAHRISDGMTFPGQIKVTVIREVTAVAVAS